MGRGVVAFLVLLAFAPTAIYLVNLYAQQAAGIAETKQFFLEQQAITVKEQDLEESFWRYMETNDQPSEWIQEMEGRGIKIRSPGVTIAKSEDNNRLVSIAGEKDALMANITVGNSKAFYLIQSGCYREYD